MNKSFIERIFPHSPESGLPRYEHDTSSRASTSKSPLRKHMSERYEDKAQSRASASRSPRRIQLRESTNSPRSSPRLREISLSAPPKSPPVEDNPPSLRALKVAPLSASIVSPENAFLPVERAARALQRTIQSFLDAQSDGLNASPTGDGADDLSSVGSPTPTPSITTSTRSPNLPRTVPVRQPIPTKITLRGARRGLSKAMEDFARLKEEELSVIASETGRRQKALIKGRTFQEKRDSLREEMQAMQGDDSATNAASLRAEAEKVKVEIKDLETRLFELRARYQQLSNQADQFSNTTESKLSSYKSSLALVEKDVKQFLRHPPVTNSLPLFDGISSGGGSMYALKPERRTLEMAQEQWTAEEDLLLQREADAKSEHEALREGVKVWRDATRRVSGFEKSLRRALTEPPLQRDMSGELVSPEDRHATLLTQLHELIASLREDLATAESNSWNLLICCLGAELEALERGRLLLAGAPGPSSTDIDVNGTHTDTDTKPDLVDEEASNPPDDLLDGAVLHSPGARSNESLQDTLKAFGDGTGSKGKGPIRADDNRRPESGLPPLRSMTAQPRDESEDDDPGPDFFLSH